LTKISRLKQSSKKRKHKNKN